MFEMTIMQGDLRGSQYKSNVTKCSICAELLLPPFLEWNCTSDLFICIECCRKHKNGLIADLVQAAAIAELRNALGPRRRDQTLVRRSVKEVNEYAQRRLAAERKIIEEEFLVHPSRLMKTITGHGGSG
jgi:hypothetical protein